MGSQEVYSTHDIIYSLFSTIIYTDMWHTRTTEETDQVLTFLLLSQTFIRRQITSFEQLFSSVSEMLLPLRVVFFPHGHTYKRLLHFLQCPLQWALVSVRSCDFQVCIYQNHLEGWLKHRLNFWFSRSRSGVKLEDLYV